jgi:hypothetical protein
LTSLSAERMEHEDNHSSNSSGSDDDEYMHDGMSEQQNQIMDFIGRSTASPFDYNLHLETIQLLSSDPLYKSQLEQQFLRFHEAFPLSLDLWTQYLALDPSMLPEALKDYLQPELYYRFVEELEDDEAEVREKKWTTVLTALGSHWQESEKVYSLYRSFLKDNISDETTLAQRVKASYDSQLTIPLFEGSERMLSEYRAWSHYQEKNNLSENNAAQSIRAIESSIQKTRAQSKCMQAFENRLNTLLLTTTQDAASLQKLWMDYLDFVQKEIKTLGCGIVLSVHERAVASVCLSAVLWQHYLDFLQDHCMISHMIEVGKRAIRNVGCHAHIWRSYLVALEWNGDFDTLDSVLDEVRARNTLSFEHLLDVLLHFIDASRRRQNKQHLDNVFQRCKVQQVPRQYNCTYLRILLSFDGSKNTL